MFLNDSLNSALNTTEINKALASLRVPVGTTKKSTKNFDASKMRWCPDKQEFYLPCEIVSIKGNEATVKLITKNEKRTVQANLLEEMNPPRYENSEDMADLTHLNDASVLHNLRSRYSLNLIYTYSGLFCVTVNPYQNLPIYGFDVMTAYREAARSSRPPHIYAVTDNTYTSMLREKENQSILITGESGSGKTENTKKVIQYFAFVGSVADSAQNPKTLENNLENQIISANPLLESYGNAKTIRNDNSSRFGKFIQIHFNSSGKIAGANISTYLLEKSRVTYQNPRERNYHIFYQLLSGAIPELQEQILIGRDVSSYVYVNRGSGKADTINDSQDMINTDKAIDVLGFSAGEKASIYRITAAVLIFGNAKWKQRNREEQAECDGTAECEKVAYLLEIDVHELMKCLLRPRIKVGSEYVNRGQSKVQVTNTVAALSKSIYERLFNWIVTKVNDKLAASSKRKHFIGVLDIAGFEIFEQNSFEQLCINYTNEKLQQFFNHYMFVLEQEEYEAEKIPWDFIDFGLDLQPCIDLIEKPMGIFSILEEECIIPKGNDAGFVTKLLEKYAGKHPNLSKHKSGKSEIKADFDIHHYAGIVAYTVFEWLDKNKDPANVSVAGLFKNSKNQLMATLFEDMGDEEIGRTGRVKKTGSMRTISAIHKEQLNCLIKTLTATHPHFVRCILPNEEKKAGLFNVRLVIQQLHCNGVLEGIRICRKGYPNRMPFSEFKRCYSILAGNDIPKGYVDSRKVAEIVLQARAISQDSYKLGQTKVFFKVGVLATLESLRERALSIIITNLQARIRSYLSLATYHHMRSRRKAIEILQKNGRTYLGFRNWKWWSLYTKLKPLLTVARQEEEMCRLKQEFDKAQVTIEAETAKRAVLECQSASLMKENDDLKSHLDLNKALLDAAEHKAETMIEKQKELESELDDLSETISSQEDTINMLRGRLRSTDEDTRKQQNEILKLNSSIASYETQLNASKSERDDLEEKVKKLMAQVQKQAKELEKKQKDLAVLGDQNGELNDKNKKLTKLKAKLESSVNTLESSVQDLTKSLNDLRRQNTSDAAEIARLKGLLNTLEGESKKLRNEIDEKVDLMACLNNQLNEEMIKGEKFHDINKKLKGENNELRNELENLQSSKYQVEVESVAKDDQIAILEEELANKTHIAKHDAETSRMREKELDKLKIELEQVKAKNEKNEVEFKRRYEALKAEQRMCEDELEKSSRKWDSNRKSLLRQLDELRSQIRELTLQKDSMENLYKQATLDITSKQSQLTKQENEIKELKREWTIMSDEIKDMKENCDVHLEEILVLKKTNQKLKSENDEYSNEISRLNKELCQSEKSKRQLEQKNSDLERDYSSLTHDLSALQTALKALQNDKGSLNSAAQIELQAKLKELEEQRHELNVALGEVKTQLSDTAVKLTKMTNESSESKRQLKKLQLALDRANADVSKFEKKEAHWERKSEDDKTAMGKLSTQIETLHKELSEKNSLILKLEHEVESKTKNTENAQRECAGLRAKIQQIEQDRYNEKDDEEEIRMLEMRIHDKDEEIDALRENEAEHKLIIEKLEVELTMTKQRLTGEIRLHLEQMNEMKKELEDKIEVAKNESDSLKKTNDGLKTEKFNLEKTMQRWSKNLEDKNEEIRILKKKLSTESDSAKSAHEGFIQCKKEKNEVTLQLDSEVRQTIKLRTEIDQLKDSLAHLERINSNSEKNCDELKDQIRVLEKANIALQEERILSDRKSMELSSELEDGKLSLDLLNQQVSELKESVNKIRTSLTKKDEELVSAIVARESAEKRYQSLKNEMADELAQREREYNRALEEFQEKHHAALIEIETCTTRHNEASRNFKAANRKIKEMNVNLLEAEKTISVLNETISQLQRRNALYKQQAEESDKNAEINLAKFKQASNEATLAAQRADYMQSRMSKMKARQRSGFTDHSAASTTDS